ncbi:unnamed protein product [Rotaria sordida]|uniref:Kinase n=1 Tax=Rotaria sordida TaxID=392033 RepID=A0A819CS24_9BILA|nr:unnamed protein product [Rotaria sordida]CAF1164803.1 unnamed protein product [Rotaria sordida]CAF3824789.1 unnamed protein product [Rotaria sordida]
MRESPPTRKIRYGLSSLSISFSKRSHLNKRKLVRDIATQSSPQQTVTHKSLHDSSHLENSNTPNMITAINSRSNEYLSNQRYYQYPTSSSCPSTKHNKSVKNTLLGLWQSFNTDELQLSSSSPVDSKYFEDHVKKNNQSRKAFSNVVTIFLTPTQVKQERNQWIQLVGHDGTFKTGIHDGYILKELCEHERHCCKLLQNDLLKDFVPKYNGTVQDEEGKLFIEIEDLLATFHEPSIMDCKIGVRTYLEEELDKSERNPEPRTDLYNKMIAIDYLAPTEKEHEEKKILKSRYMIWRESLSSSQNLGFRIEAIQKSDGLMSKEFQRIKGHNDVKKQLSEFIANSFPRAIQYLERLIKLRSACIRSNFFQTHELIGSSLLFVHDENKASIWMIDFGKTRLLPNNIHITHEKPWIRGSHEDGYLFGLDNLISILREIINEL